MIRQVLSYRYNRLLQRHSNWLFRAVLRTPPIAVNQSSDTTLYCALGRDSRREFILAAKSFLRFHSDVAVVAQDDGTLTRHCVAEICRHIPGAVVHSREDMMQMITERADRRVLDVLPDVRRYDTHTPTRIVYLKFLNVIYRFNGAKVFVIDSDIVFLRSPTFIIDWISNPYAHDFYGDGSNRRAEDFHRMGFEFKSLDVAKFSSGTIGIGGTVPEVQLLDMFRRIHGHDASLFDSWEVEQALWAIIMSSRPNPVNVDRLREVYVGSGWRSYADLRDNAILAHFFGAVRFKNLRYLRIARDVIRELRAG
jgi:hypothetical protein